MSGGFEREGKIGPRPDPRRSDPRREPIAAPDRTPRRPHTHHGPVGPANGSFGRPQARPLSKPKV